MTTFNCKSCNYDTQKKSNYNRHLKSKKHLYQQQLNSWPLIQEAIERPNLSNERPIQ